MSVAIALCVMQHTLHTCERLLNIAYIELVACACACATFVVKDANFLLHSVRCTIKKTRRTQTHAHMCTCSANHCRMCLFAMRRGKKYYYKTPALYYRSLPAGTQNTTKEFFHCAFVAFSFATSYRNISARIEL